MMVYLFFGLFWVSGVVAQPSFVESTATIPWNEVPELSNSGLQIRESGFEKSIFVSRPVSDYWVDSSKLAENSTTELNRGGIELVKPSVEVKQPSTKASQKNSSNNDEPKISDGFKHAWYWFAYTLFLNFFFGYFGYKHQQKLLDAQRIS